MKQIMLAIVCSAALYAQEANPLTDAIQTRYKRIRADLLDAAEVMPEEFYSFKLTPAQRTYAEWVGHVAMGNFSFCSVIKGEKAPDTKAVPQMKGKGELSKKLIQSFEYCDSALSGMTDKTALAARTVGEKTTYPVQGMVNLVSSGNEHYGNMVGYLRSKGVTPPSTARAAKK